MTGPESTRVEAPGPYRSTVQDVRWRDPAHGRKLPMRIRVPDAPGARPAIRFSHGLGGAIEAQRYVGAAGESRVKWRNSRRTPHIS